MLFGMISIAFLYFFPRGLRQYFLLTKHVNYIVLTLVCNCYFISRYDSIFLSFYYAALQMLTLEIHIYIYIYIYDI